VTGSGDHSSQLKWAIYVEKMQRHLVSKYVTDEETAVRLMFRIQHGVIATAYWARDWRKLLAVYADIQKSLSNIPLVTQVYYWSARFRSLDVFLRPALTCAGLGCRGTAVGSVTGLIVS